MSYEAQTYRIQQFELLMTTVFTCRSIVKYNLIPGEEQKKELLADIDTSLEVLRSYFLPDSSMHAKTASLRPQPANFSSVVSASENPIAASGVVSSSSEQQILQALYKIYHAYMSMNQGKSLNTFVSRFNDAMAMLQDIQRMIEGYDQAKDCYTFTSFVEEPLHHVKGFIADLYYIFMEFMRVLSETLQQNNVQLDTEKLCSLQVGQMVNEKPSLQYNPASLFGVYEAHQRLNRNRSVIVARITDATVFLEILKEDLSAGLRQRDEFLAPLNNIIRLLRELSSLIVDL